MSGPTWAPAERVVPELLPDLMHMRTVTTAEQYEHIDIEQYKHIDTRRYLNLDAAGRAWRLVADPDTEDVAAEQVDLRQAVAYVEGA